MLDVHMWSVTKSNSMQLAKPASLQSTSKQKNLRRQHYVCDDNECQSTKLNKKSMCSYRNCQDNKSVIILPVNLQMDMQPKEPALQSSFKKKHVLLCNDKICQSTRCFKKKCPVRPVCDDKNCQSANLM